MKELRELDLSGTVIKEAPQGLDELLKLEFRSLNAMNLEMLPSELLVKLVHLQHVSFPFHLPAPMEGIQNLKRLHEFYGSVDYVEDFNCFIGGEVNRSEYTVIVGEEERDDEYEQIEEHSFEYSSYKKNLGLFGCDLEEETVIGHDTEYVIIGDCEDLSISFLDCFLKLKKLKIERCEGIECILRSDRQGSPSITCTLEEIELKSLVHLKGVVMQREEIRTSPAPMQVVYSSLRSITIGFCNNMTKVGLPVLGLPNLEEIVIEWCRKAEEIFEVDEGRGSVITLPKLKNLTLRWLPRLRKLGLPVSGVPNLRGIHIESCGEIEEIFEEEDEERVASVLTTLTLPKLNEMSLVELPRLKSLSKTTIISDSITGIWIRKCPRLMKKLPLHMGDHPPTTLKKIFVEKEWWESLERDIDINPNLPRLLLPLVRFH